MTFDGKRFKYNENQKLWVADEDGLAFGYNPSTGLFLPKSNSWGEAEFNGGTFQLSNARGSELSPNFVGPLLPEVVRTNAIVGSNTFKPGTFSVRDWTGYPSGVPKPTGPFRLLTGAEYDAARKAANEANAALRRADPAMYVGKQIHEIQPVKFGGSPTEPANKIALPFSQHHPLTTWWKRLQDSLE